MNKEWLRAALIRAIKTMAQTGVAMIPVAVTVAQVDWLTVASTMLTAGILSILTSVAGLPEAPNVSDTDNKPSAPRTSLKRRLSGSKGASMDELPIDVQTEETQTEIQTMGRED